MKQVFVLSAEEFTSINNRLSNLIQSVIEDKENKSRDWMLKTLYEIFDILNCGE